MGLKFSMLLLVMSALIFSALGSWASKMVSVQGAEVTSESISDTIPTTGKVVTLKLVKKPFVLDTTVLMYPTVIASGKL